MTKKNKSADQRLPERTLQRIGKTGAAEAWFVRFLVENVNVNERQAEEGNERLAGS